MENILQLLLAAIIGYSLGSVSFATIISRKVKGIDIRKY
ncbi:MAG: acyl-phosphate glycerol 3-phosphate acyltransferase, partial [Firmicutes bacterium]|nr:acyl-phosphate glycerol 3-phosphate acyltransferase [Bacillota bacterium]